MLAIIPQDLDLYLVMDHRQMKAIDVDYNVRMRYWASKNNMQKYIWIFYLVQLMDLGSCFLSHWCNELI
jgi:hypothetical protein